MHTSNRADENFKKLTNLFPNAVTETIDENGEVVRAIDKDVLMQEISVKVVDGKEERYQFTWLDKKKSVLLALSVKYEMQNVLFGLPWPGLPIRCFTKNF